MIITKTGAFDNRTCACKILVYLYFARTHIKFFLICWLVETIVAKTGFLIIVFILIGLAICKFNQTQATDGGIVYTILWRFKGFSPIFEGHFFSHHLYHIMQL